MSCWSKVFLVFCTLKYSRNIIILLEKIKIKTCVKGHLCNFIMVFFLLWFSGSWRAFWYFYIEKQLFYSKKLLARVMFTRQRVGVIPTCYGWFFADGRFLLFFPFLLSLFQRKCTFVLFSLDLSISVFLFFYCLLLSLVLL